MSVVIVESQDQLVTKEPKVEMKPITLLESYKTTSEGMEAQPVEFDDIGFWLQNETVDEYGETATKNPGMLKCMEILHKFNS